MLNGLMALSKGKMRNMITVHGSQFTVNRSLE